MVAHSAVCDEPRIPTTTTTISSSDNNTLTAVNDARNHKSSSPSIKDIAEKNESIEMYNLRVTMLRPTVDSRVSYLQSFVQKLQKKGIHVVDIAKILLKADCWLSDIVSLRMADLTRAFLREKEELTNKDDDDNSDSFTLPEVVLLKNLRLKGAFGSSTIDGDSQASVDRVMNSMDVKNAEVIFKYGSDRSSRIRHYFSKIARMATTHSDRKTLKTWVFKIGEWKILDDQASRIIEREIFQKASKEVVQLFLDCRVEVRIEELFKRNALAALFGNPNVNVSFLKTLEIDVNARGCNDFTALHYAVQNSLVDKIKFLLDSGAEVNSMNRKSETPLILTLLEPQVNSIHNKKCVELLLQHNADPFMRSWEGRSFDSCINLENSPIDCLTELALVYVCLHEAAGAANLSSENAETLKGIQTLVKQNDDLFVSYTKYKQQLQQLKRDKIREELTMFTIASQTGDKLIRLVDEKDRRAITNFIEKYSNGTLHPYYLNALQEHMRQFRQLLTCRNRAMLVITDRVKKPVAPRKVLGKVISDLTCKDLLIFQSGSEKLMSVVSCSEKLA